MVLSQTGILAVDSALRVALICQFCGRYLQSYRISRDWNISGIAHWKKDKAMHAK
jgi:hypothetical protein